jgi:hypothetical protein
MESYFLNRVYVNLFPLIQSLAELFHHQKKVISILCEGVQKASALHLKSHLDLIAVCCR